MTENNNQGKPMTKEAEVRMWKTVGIILIVLMIGAFILAGFIMVKIHKTQQQWGDGLIKIMNNQTCERENVTVCQKVGLYDEDWESKPFRQPIKVWKDVSCNETYDREIQQEVCRA